MVIHNHEVSGSIPDLATKKIKRLHNQTCGRFFIVDT